MRFLASAIGMVFIIGLMAYGGYTWLINRAGEKARLKKYEQQERQARSNSSAAQNSDNPTSNKEV